MCNTTNNRIRLHRMSTQSTITCCSKLSKLELSDSARLTRAWFRSVFRRRVSPSRRKCRRCHFRAVGGGRTEIVGGHDEMVPLSCFYFDLKAERFLPLSSRFFGYVRYAPITAPDRKPANTAHGNTDGGWVHERKQERFSPSSAAKLCCELQSHDF